MGVLIAAATGMGWFNAVVLRIGMWLGAGCLAVMTSAILMQVWYRYVLGNALPWSEELSRFLMLWLTGLMAPTAFRRGGFVAIDMLRLMLPRAVSAVIEIVLLALSLIVLVYAFRIGLSELSGLGARFATSALWYPSGFAPLEWTKVPRGWMMMSFHVGVSLLLLVNVELLLRALARLAGGARELPAIAGADIGGAE